MHYKNKIEIPSHFGMTKIKLLQFCHADPCTELDSVSFQHLMRLLGSKENDNERI